jgi:hypothetical protein
VALPLLRGVLRYGVENAWGRRRSPDRRIGWKLR